MGERHAGLVISFNLVKIICRSLIICVDPDVINFTVQLKIGGKRDPQKIIYTVYIYIYTPVYDSVLQNVARIFLKYKGCSQSIIWIDTHTCNPAASKLSTSLHFIWLGKWVLMGCSTRGIPALMMRDSQRISHYGMGLGNI